MEFGHAFIFMIQLKLGGIIILHRNNTRTYVWVFTLKKAPASMV